MAKLHGTVPKIVGSYRAYINQYVLVTVISTLPWCTWMVTAGQQPAKQNGIGFLPQRKPIPGDSK